MDSMKIEIEVPVVPEGWRVVGRRKVRRGDMWLVENDGWEYWDMSYGSHSIQIVAERINPPIVLNPLLVKVLPDGWIAHDFCWRFYKCKPIHVDRRWLSASGEGWHLMALNQSLFPDVKPEDSLFQIKGDA